MKNISIRLLEFSERLFLKAHGWIELDGKYYSPVGYPSKLNDKKREGYARSHAVNSQKQYVYNKVCGGTRTDPDLRKVDKK